MIDPNIDIYSFKEGREAIGEALQKVLRTKSAKRQRILFISRKFEDDFWTPMRHRFEGAEIDFLTNGCSFYDRDNQKDPVAWLDEQLPDAITKKKYHIIFCLFELHFCINWRKGLINLLDCLKSGGDFIFAELTGNYELLDGNFKRRNKNIRSSENQGAFEKIMLEFDEFRNRHFYWKPEISASNYTELSNLVEYFFDEVITVPFPQNGNSVDKLDDTNTFQLDDNDLKDWITSPWSENHKKRKLTYLLYGTPIKSFTEESFIQKIPNYKGEEKKIEIKKGLRIYVARKFCPKWLRKNVKNGDKQNVFQNWNYKTLTKDLRQINDSKMHLLAQKALDVIMAHGVFVPKHTLYCGIISWPENEETWSFPLHIAFNERMYSEYDMRAGAATNYMQGRITHLLLLENILGGLPLKMMFTQIKRKFPIIIRVMEDPETELRKRNEWETPNSPPYKVLEPEDKKQENRIFYQLIYDGKSFVKRMVLAISPKFSPITEIKLPETNKWGEEGFITHNIRLKGNIGDTNPSSEDLLFNRFTIDQKFKENVEKEYDDYLQKTAEQLVISPSKYHEKGEFCKSVGLTKEKPETGLDDFDQFVLSLYAMKLFQLGEPGWQMSIFPSGVVEEPDDEDKSASSKTVKGLGGFFIYEKIDPPENTTPGEALLRSLLFARNRAMEAACNEVFYKAGVVNYVNLGFRTLAVRSAIGSITARNGSHGLGSHVLPSVADNTASLYDDRYLFRYIQQRLDYITQASSEFPHWTSSVWFVKDIMGQFFMQKHLLDNLAGAEKLRAYDFNPDKKGEQKGGRIEWRIRKRKLILLDEHQSIEDLLKDFADSGKAYEFSKYLEKQDKHPKNWEFAMYGVVKRWDDKTLYLISANEFPVYLSEDSKKDVSVNKGDRVFVKGKFEKCRGADCYQLTNARIVAKSEVTWFVHPDMDTSENLNKDVQIASPGGVVGFQAFYTILENVIRNVAKHNWMDMSEEEKAKRNLVVNIEIDEREDLKYYFCRVWTNLCQLRYINGIYRGDGPDFTDEAILSIENPKHRKSKNKEEKEVLLVKLNEYLKECIINTDGQTNRTHLGVSEMKIAAGFLSQQRLESIGPIEGEKVLLDIPNGEEGYISTLPIISFAKSQGYYASA